MEIYSHLHDVELPRSWGSLARFHHHDGAHDGDHHTLPALQYTKDYYNKDVDQGDHVAVCVGKEWYRYPSSFYLRPWSRLYFLQSGFTGQLPSKYIEHGDVYGTMAHTPHMNDNNEEEISRYIDYKECHYIVDLDLGPGSETDRDPRYTSIEHSSQFEIILRVPFLNSATSPQLTRAFYIPSQDHRNQYSSYVLLKNRHAPSPHMNSKRYKRF